MRESKVIQAARAAESINRIPHRRGHPERTREGSRHHREASKILREYTQDDRRRGMAQAKDKLRKFASVVVVVFLAHTAIPTNSVVGRLIVIEPVTVQFTPSLLS